MSFACFYSRHVLKEKKLKGQFVLLLLISLLVSYGLVFVNSMIEGIRERYVLLSDGEITVEGSYPGGDEVALASALIYGSDTVLPVALKGVDDSYLQGKRNRALRTLSLSEERDAHSVILGKSLAEQLGLHLNDRALIVIALGSSFRPLLAKVGGIYDSGYAELDANLVFLPFETLKPYGVPIQSELLAVEDVPKTLEKIREQGYQAHAWYEKENDLAQNLATSQKLIWFIFLVIILLAAYFASEFAVTLVYDRRRDIALLSLMGATHRTIMHAFARGICILESLAVFLGVLAGMLLSFLSKPIFGCVSDVGFPALKYYLLSFSIRIPWGQLVSFALLLLASSLVSALIGMRGMRRIDALFLVS